jgi:hypothetical protein
MDKKKKWKRNPQITVNVIKGIISNRDFTETEMLNMIRFLIKTGG